MRTSFLLIPLLLVACSPRLATIPAPATPSTSASPPAATVTVLPIATPTITPTITPTLTATAPPSGPCDNPLLPLGVANQWTYQVTSSIGGSRFSLKSLGIQQGKNNVALVEYADQKNNLTLNEQVTCQDGAIVNYPLFVLNMLFSDFLNTYVSAKMESGTYAPGYQSLLQTNWSFTWKAVYLTGNMALIKSPWGQGDMVIPVATHIESSFYVNDLRESVTTPAGTFPDALVVTQTLTLPVTITASGGGSGGADSLLIGIAQWYEPYLGLVRAQINSAYHGGGKQKLPIEGDLELVEFTPGK